MLKRKLCFTSCFLIQVSSEHSVWQSNFALVADLHCYSFITVVTEFLLVALEMSILIVFVNAKHTFLIQLCSLSFTFP